VLTRRLETGFAPKNPDIQSGLEIAWLIFDRYCANSPDPAVSLWSTTITARCK
jgi:hypothetical protein